MKIVKYLLLIFISLALSQNALSQSDNYWSWNFNTLSILLAGTAVGGYADASEIYFNPALIRQDAGRSLTLSASLLSIQSFKADNLAGDGIDLDKLALKVQPRFISFNFPSRNSKINIEASILTPVSEDIRYTLQHFDETDIIQRTEGMETYSGYLRYSRQYEDIYIGAGGSYKINDHLSVGASTFVSVKIMKYEYRQIASAYQESDSVTIDEGVEPKYIAQSSFEEALKYWDVSLVFKLGAHYGLLDDRLGFGVNLTLPNVPLFGLADVRKSGLRTNVYNNISDQFTSNESFTGEEYDARTRIKSPFSAAFGMQYITKSGRNSISFSLEYFHHIDLYELFPADYQAGNIPDYWSRTTDPAGLMNYSYKANSVTNVAIGFKQYISPSLFILGGFRTDFTNGDIDNIRDIENAFKVNQIHLNKYHITLGPVFKLKNAQLITGIQYSLGRNDDMDQVVNYSDPVEFNEETRRSLEGNRQKNMNVRLNEIALFLGLTLDSKKN